MVFNNRNYLQIDWGDWSTMKHPIRTLRDGLVPTFISNLKDEYTVNENESLELIVSYSGQPDPHIRWLKDAIEIMENANYSVIFNPTSQECKLVIRKIQCEHSGVYSCQLGKHACLYYITEQLLK